MAEPARASYQERTAEEHTRQSVENQAKWIEPKTADELLAKLKNLHAQTERHDELLGVCETLHDNERRFREMIDALPAAIYTTNAEGRLTHFNPAAIRLSCRVPDVGSDKWCVNWKLFWPDGTPMPHEESPMALALKKGRAIRDAEIIAERPDGKRLWLTVYPTPLRDVDGRIVGGINMLVDRTEQRRSEAQLRESEERYRVLAGKLDAEARAQTKELEERNAEILEQTERLRVLSNRLMQSQDDERRRLRANCTTAWGSIWRRWGCRSKRRGEARRKSRCKSPRSSTKRRRLCGNARRRFARSRICCIRRCWRNWDWYRRLSGTWKDLPSGVTWKCSWNFRPSSDGWTSPLSWRCFACCRNA